MNTSLAHDIIDNHTRVSTAVIHYEYNYGYYQYETWIFKSDGSRSTQIIHGSSMYQSEHLRKTALKVHSYVVTNLINLKTQTKK